MSNNQLLLTPTDYDHNYTIGGHKQILLVKEATKQIKKKLCNVQNLIRGFPEIGALLPKTNTVRILILGSENQDADAISRIAASVQTDLASVGPVNLILLDLGSGVGRLELDDHSLAPLRRDEIRRSFRHSLASVLCSFLSEDKKQITLPPAFVPQPVLKHLAGVMNRVDEARLRRWYRLDQNSGSAQYCLLPVSSQFPDYLSDNRTAAEAAEASWLAEAAALLTSMRAAASAIAGLGVMPAAWATGAAFADATSTIDDVINQLEADESLSSGTDLLLGCVEPSEFLSTLRRSLDAASSLVSPPTALEAAGHLRVRRRLLKMAAIGDDVEGDDRHPSWTRARQNIVDYAQSTSSWSRTRPLLVVGPAGVGKATLLADASARLASSSASTSNVAAVLFRLAGADSELTSCSGIVRSLLRQLYCIFGQAVCEPPRHIHDELSEASLFAHFAACLDQLSAQQLTPHSQLVAIFVAGLDRLQAASWLPSECPPGVRIVVSCSPELASDWGHFLYSNSNVIRLGEPSVAEAAQLAVRVLAAGWRGRRLQSAQLKVALKTAANLSRCCCSCGFGLTLRLAMAEASRWSSDFEPDVVAVQPGGGSPGCGVRLMMQLAFERLERRYGERPVRNLFKAVTYLSAISGGITEPELLAFLASSRAPQLQNPQLWWCRLRRDARGHLVTLGEDGGAPLITWCHPSLTRAARERYLCRNHGADDDDQTLIDRLCSAVTAASPGNRCYRLVPLLRRDALRRWRWTGGGQPVCADSCLSRPELDESESPPSYPLLAAYKTSVCFSLPWLFAKQEAAGLRSLLEDCWIAARVDSESMQLYDVLASILSMPLRPDGQRGLSAEILARFDDSNAPTLTAQLLDAARACLVGADGQASLLPLTACSPVASLDGQELLSARSGGLSRILYTSTDGCSIVVLTAASSSSAEVSVELSEPGTDRLLCRLTTLKAKRCSSSNSNFGQKDDGDKKVSSCSIEHFFLCPATSKSERRFVTLSGDFDTLTVWEAASGRPLRRCHLRSDDQHVDEIDDDRQIDDIDDRQIDDIDDQQFDDIDDRQIDDIDDQQLDDIDDRQIDDIDDRQIDNIDDRQIDDIDYRQIDDIDYRQIDDIDDRQIDDIDDRQIDDIDDPWQQKFRLLAADPTASWCILLRLSAAAAAADADDDDEEPGELLVADTKMSASNLLALKPPKDKEHHKDSLLAPAGACFVDSRACLVLWTAASRRRRQSDHSGLFELISLSSSGNQLTAFVADRIEFHWPAGCKTSRFELFPLTVGGSDDVIDAVLVLVDNRPAFYLIDRLRPLQLAGNGRYFDWSPDVAIATLITRSRIYFVCENSVKFERLDRLTAARRPTGLINFSDESGSAGCAQVDQQDRLLFAGFANQVQAWSVAQRRLLRTVSVVGEVVSLGLPSGSSSPTRSRVRLFGIVSQGEHRRALTSWSFSADGLDDDEGRPWWSRDPAVAAHPLVDCAAGATVAVIHAPAGVAAYWKVSRDAACLTSAIDMLAEQNGASPASSAPLNNSRRLGLSDIQIFTSNSCQGNLAALLVSEAGQGGAKAVVLFNLAERRRIYSLRRLPAEVRWIRTVKQHVGLVELADNGRRLCHLYELRNLDSASSLKLIQSVEIPAAISDAFGEVFSHPGLILSPDSAYVVSLDNAESFSVWSLLDARGDRAKGSAVPLKSRIGAAGGISNENCVGFFDRSADGKVFVAIGLKSGDLLAFQPTDAYKVAVELPKAIKASSPAAAVKQASNFRSNRFKFLTVARGVHPASTGGIARLRCFADGLAVTCGGDGCAMLWHWRSEELMFDCLVKLEGRACPILDADVSQDTQLTTVTASQDGTLRVWLSNNPVAEFRVGGSVSMSAKFARLVAASSAAVVLLDSGNFAAFGLIGCQS